MTIKRMLLALLMAQWVRPVFAQEVEAATSGRSALAAFLTFLPLILFLGLMVYFFGYFKKAAARAKRCEEHMDRVEELLERVATAVEKDQGN